PQGPPARATAGPDPPRGGASPQTVFSCDSLPQGVLHFLWLPCPSAVWQACIIARGGSVAGTLHAPPSGLVCEHLQEAAVEIAAPVVLGQAEAIQVHERRDVHRLQIRAADGRRGAVEARTLHHRFPAPSCFPPATPLRLGDGSGACACYRATAVPLSSPVSAAAELSTPSRRPLPEHTTLPG